MLGPPLLPHHHQNRRFRGRRWGLFGWEIYRGVFYHGWDGAVPAWGAGDWECGVKDLLIG